MMNRACTTFVVFLAAVLASSCVKNENPLVVGQPIQGGYKPGSLSVQIPLPEGNWEVAEYTTEINNVGTLIVLGTVIERRGDLLTRAASFRVPAYYASGGYKVPSTCTRIDMHFSEVKKKVEGSDQDCRWLNHFRPTLVGSSSERMNQIGEYLQGQNISLPNHLIQTGYWLADEGSFLSLNFYFNPVANGFDDFPRSTWQDSPWHPSTTVNFPKRQAYINDRWDWAKDYYPQVKAAFEGKIEGAKKQSSSRDIVNPSKSSTAERLKELERLHSDGLISDKEFNLKRTEILRGL